MKKQQNLGLILLFIIISSSFSSANAYIPPTNAFDKVGTSNSTIYAPDYESKLNIVGVGNATVTGSNNSKTVYITVTTANGKNGNNGTNGSNGTTISPITCLNDYQLHSLTVIGTLGTLHCAVNNSTSGSATYDFIHNVGTAGIGFYKGNTTKIDFNFKNLTSNRSDLISISTDANNVILDSNFREPDIDCGGGHFLRKLVNSTGFTCAAESGGTITTASNDGHGGKGLFKDTTGSTINLRNITSTRTDLITVTQNLTDVNLGSSFKSNNVSCSPSFFVSSFNNSTGVYTCTAESAGTITSASNIGTSGFGFFRDITGGNTINLRNLTTTRSDLFTLSQSANNVNLASSFKSNTFTCSAGNAVTAFSNSTGTYTCSPFGSGTITTASNVGTGGKGFFKDISPSNQLNLRNLTTTTNLLTISQSLTDVILSSTFKLNSITCQANFFINLISNTTISTCALPLNTAQIGNLGTANGLGLFVNRPNATENDLRSISCGFNLSCSNNSTNTRINQTRPNESIYVTESVLNTVSLYNFNFTKIKSIPVGTTPVGIAFNPINQMMYIANSGSASVSVINSTNAVIKTITVGTTPRLILFDPFDQNMYVTNNGDGTVSVINSTSNSVIKTITVGDTPDGITLNTLTGNIYVVNVGGSSVSVINSTGSVTKTITVGTNPRHIVFDPLNQLIYVANSGSASVSVINSTNAVIKTITVGNVQLGIGFNPINQNIYVGRYDGITGFISVINSTNAVTKTITLGLGVQPYGIVFDPNSNYMFVGSTSGSQGISVIDLENNIVKHFDIGVNSRLFGFISNNYKLGVMGGSLGRSGITIYNGTINNVMEFAKILSANNNCSVIRNQTNVIINCITQAGTGVSSINGTSGAYNINAHDRVLTSSKSGQTTTISGKPNIVTTNETNQRITPQITLQNPQLNGFACAERWKTSAYTVTPYDCTLEVNATTGTDPTIVTLPAVSTMGNSTITIKKIDWSTKTVKIISTSPDLIDLWRNANLTNQGDYIQLVDNKTNWIIVDQTTKDYNSFHIKGTSPNKWYGTITIPITNATFTPVVNSIYATQFITSSPMKIDQIRIGVTTSGASSLCRAGIYTSNSTLAPNILVSGSDVGTFTTSTIGIKTNTFTNPIILQGNSLYWLATNCQATVPLLTGLPLGSYSSVLGSNSTRMGGQQELTGWRAHFTFAAMPIVFPVNATTQNIVMPMVQVRIIG